MQIIGENVVVNVRDMDMLTWDYHWRRGGTVTIQRAKGILHQQDNHFAMTSNKNVFLNPLTTKNKVVGAFTKITNM